MNVNVPRDVLLEGGTAVDAAVACLFCNGVVNSQSTGLGGGFLMTIYIQKEKRAITLDARETAPAAAREVNRHLSLKNILEMFSNKRK